MPTQRKRFFCKRLLQNDVLWKFWLAWLISLLPFPLCFSRRRSPNGEYAFRSRKVIYSVSACGFVCVAAILGELGKLLWWKKIINAVFIVCFVTWTKILEQFLNKFGPRVPKTPKLFGKLSLCSTTNSIKLF